jgi:hypothetical protein
MLDLIQFFYGLFAAASLSPAAWMAGFGLAVFGYTWTTKVANTTTVAAAHINLLQTEKVDCDGEIPFDNTGCHILDTNASHDLIIKPGSDLTADRTLTLTTGDADRTVTLNGNPTLNDWFDQDVKSTASPTHVTETLSGLTASVPVVTNGSKALASQTYANFKTSLAIVVADLGDAAWTAFTPAWANVTEGSGTNEGYYKQIGKTVFFRARFIMAADSSVGGAISITLPVAAATYSSVTLAGQGIVYDADPGVLYQITVSSGGTLRAIGTGASYATTREANATVPMTWAENDWISIQGFYEAA